MLTERAIEREDRIKLAVSRLVSMDAAGDSIRLALPIAYPSGACAAVQISINKDECFITDCALGYAEAEFASAQSYYDHAARATSQHFGVQYDGVNVFASRAPVDRLEGAIVAVANASVQAVTHAIMRAVTDKERRSNTQLFDKVSDIFGARHVARTADLKGREAEWQAHNVVTIDGAIAVFEFVTAHQNSIANKFQMFSDLHRGSIKPSLNAVVRSLSEIGSKGTMLADVSHLFEITAANDDFKRFARMVA
jgi:hypothetical protein